MSQPGSEQGQKTLAPLRSWASESLPGPVCDALNRLRRSEDVHRIAVMPDVHLSRHVCVGTVFATTALVYPDAIGGDIGCGMTAVALDAVRGDVKRRRAERALGCMRDAVPIKWQRLGDSRAFPEAMPRDHELSSRSLKQIARKEATHQLGTLGTGNHFLELQHDSSTGRLWLMVHSGSRGMGQAIRKEHIDAATKGRGGLLSLDAREERGQAYLNDMHWGRRYARANRASMLRAVSGLFEAAFGWSIDASTLFDCDHNHIEAEVHDGETRLVHRKGAMSAWEGQAGIVPGSMATSSFHVEGRGLAESLCSSAHGAGRAMSRSAARRRITRDRLRHELRGVHLDPATLRGLIDEAPSAYKDVHAVMKAQRPLVKVVRELRPLVTFKGC